MAENNKAEVKIFGQSYTIAGTASVEDMEHVAEYVDGIMSQLSKNLPSLTTMSLAVLTAVNTASDYFEAMKMNQSQSEELKSARADLENYSRLWEDAKESLLKYQEESRGSVEKLQDLQRIFNKKNEELNQMRAALDEMTEKYQETLRLLKEAETLAASQAEEQSKKETADQELADLEKENEELRTRAAALEEKVEKLSAKGGRQANAKKMADFQDKYKELENSFFDIQMENIQLKNELDEYRKQDSE